MPVAAVDPPQDRAAQNHIISRSWEDMITKAVIMLCAKMDGEPDLNAEIDRELQLIQDDDPIFQDDEFAHEDEIVNVPDNDINEESVMQEFAVPYLERVQSRTGAFMKCLAECDELLKTIDTRDTERNPDQSFLKFAADEGVEDVEAFKSMIISEADHQQREEEALKSARSVAVTDENYSKAAEANEGNHLDNVTDSETNCVNDSNVDDVDNKSEMVNNNNSDEGDVEDLMHVNGNISELMNETTERSQHNAINEYQQWTEKWLTKKTQRKMVEEDKKKKDMERVALIEQKRSEKLMELETQKRKETQHQQQIEENLNKEMEEEEKKIIASLEIYQAEINKLAQDIAIEQKNLEISKEERKQQDELKKNKSAKKIQSLWRGYRVRKLHRDALKERLMKMKAEREAAMFKEIEERRNENEQKKEEKRLAEEKAEKDRQERIRMEDLRKKEADKKIVEDERRKKEEREKKDMEEKERKEREDIDRKQKEERERKETEERERKEKEEKDKSEKEEKEKQENERKEKERKEKEEEELREKEQLEKERKEKERQEAERMKKEEEKKQKQLELRKKEEERRKMDEERNKQEEIRKREEAAKKKERERKLQLMMTLPKELESMRLAWMKSCQPWSKSKQELKRRKPSSAKKQLRRPLSGKKLLPLKEDVILSAAQASSLQQITTVELKDLPGFSTSPLGGCKNLKHLVINNCHLVALEGFEQHGSLQYLDLKNNDIEALSLTDVSSLAWFDVSHNNLSSIHGLDGCQNIRHLNLSHNRITRIACTEWLTNLHTLDLSHNQLITTKGLGQMTALQNLNLSSNHIANIEDFAPLSLLAFLDASSNNLLQIPLFENQVLLRQLNLQDNSLSSVDEFSNAWLPLLHTLVLSNNGLMELSSLGNLVSLRKLNVSHNQLIDLESILPGIKECRQLCHLTLDENPFTEENNYRALMKEQVPTLREVDGASVSDDSDAADEDALTGFELMCRCQNEVCDKLKVAYSEVLRKDIGVCADLLKLHLTCMDEDVRLAEEHRFTHEFGSVSSHLDTTLKVNFKDIIKKSLTKRKESSSGASTVATAESVMQNASIQNKNKFEEALNKVNPKPPSVPKTQPSRNLNQGAKSLSSPSKQKNPDVGNRNLDNDSKNLESKVERQDLQEGQGQLSRAGGQSSRTTTHRNIPGSVSASKVQKILQNEQEEIKSSRLQTRAATIIQANWRGHSVRREIDKLTKRCLATTVIQAAYRGRRFRENLTQYLWPGANLQVLDSSAVKIQALWRGYTLRKRLQQALEFARLESGEDLEDEEFPEVDLDDFNFDEDGFNQGWVPPETPQLPSSHAVLRNTSNDNGDRRGHKNGDATNLKADNAARIQLFQQVPQAPAIPIYAWEKSDARFHQQDLPPGGKPPLPPLSRFSDATSDVSLPGAGETTRTMNSKRSDKLAEEWGFKDSRTAELMMARAKKLKYNAQRKQKYSQLDPKQRLALYKKLEENSRVKPIQLPPKKSVPRKEYFQEPAQSGPTVTPAKANEMRAEEMNREQERHHKVSRTYEWLHTQAGVDDLPTGRTLPSQGSTNLPHIDLSNRGRAQLMASPSLELQSIGSGSCTDLASYRRHSSASENGGKLLFPAIKTGSAPLAQVKERISFRDAPVEKSVGWGGGKKRGIPK